MLPRRFGPGCGCLFCVPAVAIAHYTHTPSPPRPALPRPFCIQHPQAATFTCRPFRARLYSLFFIVVWFSRSRVWLFVSFNAAANVFAAKLCQQIARIRHSIPPFLPPPSHLWTDLYLCPTRTVSIRSERTFCHVRNALAEPFCLPAPYLTAPLCLWPSKNQHLNVYLPQSHRVQKKKEEREWERVGKKAQSVWVSCWFIEKVRLVSSWWYDDDPWLVWKGIHIKKRVEHKNNTWSESYVSAFFLLSVRKCWK